MKPDPDLLHLFKVKGKGQSQYSEIFTHLKAESMCFTNDTANLILHIPILPQFTTPFGTLSSQSLINFIDHLALLVCHIYNPSDLVSLTLKISFFSFPNEGQDLKIELTSQKKSDPVYGIITVVVTSNSELVAIGSAALKFTNNRPWRAPKI